MKKFLSFCLILFVFLFGHIYQKVKIVTLAYQIHHKKLELDNLVEERCDFVYNFYKEANLSAINQRLTQSELDLNYPKKYVRLGADDLDKVKQQDTLDQSLLVKILSFTSQVEARP